MKVRKTNIYAKSPTKRLNLKIYFIYTKIIQLIALRKTKSPQTKTLQYVAFYYSSTNNIYIYFKNKYKYFEFMQSIYLTHIGSCLNIFVLYYT